MTPPNTEVGFARRSMLAQNIYARLRSVIAIFLLCSVLIALSFFFRHIAGIVVTQGAYNPLVYNPADVRSASPPKYDYLPDDVVWDEVRAYARTTQGFLRGEYGGAVLESYAPYVTSPLPRRQVFLRDGLGQSLLGEMARMFGGSVPAAFCAADFVFVFMLAMSLLAFCWELKRFLAFAVGTTSLFMFFNWQDVLNLVRFFREGIQNSSFIIRTPYPQLALVVFLTFLIFLKRTVEKPGITVAAGLALTAALNFYTYFFAWPVVVMCIFATLLVLGTSARSGLNLVGTTRKESARAFWTVLGAGFAAMIISAPVWLGYIRKTPDVVDTFLRFNGEFTHRPNVKYTVLLLGLLAAGLLAKQRWKAQVHWIYFVLVLAFLGVMNIQVISGKTIQPNHWSSYFVQPFMIIALAHFGWQFAEKLGTRRLNALVALVLSLGVGLNVWKFWSAAVDSQHYQTKDPAFVQLTDRLRGADLAGYGFVTNDYYVSLLLPAYVRMKPLEPSYMDPISNYEIWQLRLAVAKSAGFDDWDSFAAASGRHMPLQGKISPLQFNEDRVLLVMNKHRTIPERVRWHRCEVFSNQDFLVLKPCKQ